VSTVVSEQFSTSPTNHITAIVGDAEVADSVRNAIDAADLGEVTVDVVEPEQSDEATIAPGDQEASEGLLARVRKLLGDETPHLEHLADALQAGAHVVCVGLPDPDGIGRAAHEDVKRRAARLLLDAGATAVTYHGRWGIEELTTPL